MQALNAFFIAPAVAGVVPADADLDPPVAGAAPRAARQGRRRARQADGRRVHRGRSLTVGFWQTLSGRTTPRRPTSTRCSGCRAPRSRCRRRWTSRPPASGPVCYREAEGAGVPRRGGAARGAARLRRGPGRRAVDDTFGFTWLVVRTEPDDLGALVTDLHAVNSSLEAEGFARGLLCRWSASATGPGARWGWSTSTAGHLLPVRSRGRAGGPQARDAAGDAGAHHARARAARGAATSRTGCRSGAAPLASDPGRPADQSRWLLPGRSSIRWRATLAQCSVSGSTSITVDDGAVDEDLHRPHEVGEVDPVHRRAVADGLVEEHDPLVGVLRPPAASPG